MNNVKKKESVFATDSSSYSLLHNAVKQITKSSGLVCEIGTRRAGSTKIIIDSLVESGNEDCTLICIDPYGDIPYPEADGISLHHDYTNSMRNETIPSLYEYAYKRIGNFVFFNMEDSEFFKRFSDGVPVYSNTKNIVGTYDFVFFDGPHDLINVKLETEFFLPRTLPGSIFVYDDTEGHYNHSIIEKECLFPNNWEVLESSTRKMSYIKK